MAPFSKKNAVRSPRLESGRRPAVTSYYRSKSSLEVPSPFKKKAARRSTRKLLFGFMDIALIAIILLAVGYSLMVKPSPKIIASDLSYRPAASYQAAAEAQLDQLKNRNKITLDEQSISLSLQKQFPEISSVQVELPFFSEQPTIRLTVAMPSLVLKSQADSFIVSSGGVAVGKASQFPDIKSLAVVDDQSGFTIHAGNQVLSSTAISFINNLIAQCQLAKVPIASLTLPPAVQELDLRTKDQPYYVKFFIGGDALDESGQFLAARKHFGDAHQPPSQYLDVRVAGKIFYK